jgi:hypothetical protein
MLERESVCVLVSAYVREREIVCVLVSVCVSVFFSFSACVCHCEGACANRCSYFPKFFVFFNLEIAELQ